MAECLIFSTSRLILSSVRKINGQVQLMSFMFFNLLFYCLLNLLFIHLVYFFTFQTIVSTWLY